MKMLKRFNSALPLAGLGFLYLALAGCGSGGDAPAAPPVAGAVVGEPSPNGGAPSSAPFVARAQRGTACSNYSNRLYLIDNKYVFSSLEGSCENGYFKETALFGATPDLAFCSRSTAAGEAANVKACGDDKLNLLTLFNNLSLSSFMNDVGRGPGSVGHTVEEWYFLPKDGTTLSSATIARDQRSSIHTARTVLVRDGAAFAALWTEHNGGRANPAPLPIVDFNKEMVIGVFAGDVQGCHDVGIGRVVVDGARMVAEYEDRDRGGAADCAATSSAPMHLVVLDRKDAALAFAAIQPVHLAYTRLDGTLPSRAVQRRDQIVKDAASWAEVWKMHRADLDEAAFPAKPEIDFSKRMVVAVFLGSRPDTCYDVDVSDIYRINGKIRVNVVERVMGRNAALACGASFVYPGSLIELQRSDEPVEFVHRVSPVAPGRTQ